MRLSSKYSPYYSYSHSHSLSERLDLPLAFYSIHFNLAEASKRGHLAQTPGRRGPLTEPKATEDERAEYDHPFESTIKMNARHLFI